MVRLGLLLLACASAATSGTLRTLHGRAVCTACFHLVDDAIVLVDDDHCRQRCADLDGPYGLVVVAGDREALWHLTGERGRIQSLLGQRLQVTGVAERTAGRRTLLVEQIVADPPPGAAPRSGRDPELLGDLVRPVSRRDAGARADRARLRQA